MKRKTSRWLPVVGVFILALVTWQIASASANWFVVATKQSDPRCDCAWARFRHNDGREYEACCIEVDCGGTIPAIGQEYKEDFSGDGIILVPTGEDKPPGLQRFKVIEQPPQPTPTPVPVPSEFSVDVSCPTPGSHSDDLKIVVTVLDQNGKPLAGVEVIVYPAETASWGKKTDGNGKAVFPYPDARSRIGDEVKVQADDLELQSFTITSELFAPCTAACDALSAVYDPGNGLADLTVEGSQPGMDVVVWDLTLGEEVICTGVLDGDGRFGCQDTSLSWGVNLWRAQVGGSSGPTCEDKIETPFPAELTLQAVCPTPGRDSDDLVFSGEMRDQFGELFTETFSLTFSFPDGSQTNVEVTNGKFADVEFLGAKAHTGEKVVVTWPEGGYLEFEITGELFKPCRTPPPTPTPVPPTPTPQPRFGADPDSEITSNRGRLISAWEGRQAQSATPSIGLELSLAALAVLLVLAGIRIKR